MQNARRDTNGNIAPGSVQLVTTSEDSYIQIENQSGQKQIVSKMVGGNANLKKGQSTSVDISKQLQHIVANPNINQNVENMLKKEVQQHQVVNQRNLQRALNDTRRNPQGFKGTDLR
ncbi:hypothetical protein [Ornithinibacillus scapharcae]|uniref:hypothetical protein n=1 Tax=Ornithinibacillus scapharcae TaxID=1147159 RepID=UPI000225BDD9|nr:hypothetical protein [Ornithinibacillus scapharcae]